MKKRMVPAIVLVLTAVFAAPFGLTAQENPAQENDIKGVDSPGSSGIRLAVGPDAFGYIGRDETEPDGPVYNFIDILGTGTDTGIFGDDDGSAPLNIGFPFDFYGTVYNTVAMSTNGYLNFNTGGDLTDFGNDCPGLNAFDPDQSIYVYWDDLTIRPGAGGLVETFANCPNTSGGTGQCTIFMWFQVDHIGGSSPWNMEAILYDNFNILLQFGPGNPETGGSATIGLENQTPSSIGLDYACNTVGTIPANRAILFIHPFPPVADLAVTKTCITTGIDVSCTINITNLGPGTASNVVVTDNIPAELTYASDNGCGGVGTVAPPAAGPNGTWTWDAFDLTFPAGNTASCTIDFVFTTPTAGVTNDVTVSADQMDPDGTNNTSTAPITVGVTDISVEKACVATGTDVSCTIDVTNFGPGNATNVIVADDIPAELTYVGDDGCGGIGTVTPPTAGPNGTWTWDGFDLTFPAGNTASCTLDFQITTLVDGIINEVSVTADELDIFPTNNAAAAVIGVIAIPTLSATGLVLLLLVLSTAAFFVLRRRRA